jgi:hypothetical protein
MENNELKNGTELVLSLALSLDLLEQYKTSKLLKRKINQAKDEIEKAIGTHYNQLYKSDEEFVQNSLRYKESVIKKIAKYNEADCILAADFLEKFDNNIELARKKGTIFFDKLI